MGIGLGFCCCGACECHNAVFPGEGDKVAATYELTIEGLIDYCEDGNGTHELTYLGGSFLTPPYLVSYRKSIGVGGEVHSWTLQIAAQCPGQFTIGLPDRYASIVFLRNAPTLNFTTTWACGEDTEGFELVSGTFTCADDNPTAEVVRLT